MTYLCSLLLRVLTAIKGMRQIGTCVEWSRMAAARTTPGRRPRGPGGAGLWRGRPSRGSPRRAATEAGAAAAGMHMRVLIYMSALAVRGMALRPSPQSALLHPTPLPCRPARCRAVPGCPGGPPALVLRFRGCGGMAARLCLNSKEWRIES